MRDRTGRIADSFTVALDFDALLPGTFVFASAYLPGRTLQC